MFHKGLNKEMVVTSARELIEQEGIRQFSMRRLAEKLGVKTASLYTHIENMEALFTEVGLSALRIQKEHMESAIMGKRCDDAVFALAEAFHKFAFEHPQLYRLIMQIPTGNDAVLKEAAAMTVEPFMGVLADYSISVSRRMHWQHVLRGLMHGFVSEEQAGYFSHCPVSVDESYEIAVQCVIDGLRREEGEWHE